MAKKIQDNSFPIKGWKMIFYAFGWLTGVLNLLFWLLMAIFYFAKDKDEGKPFFNPDFHKRVFWWGVVIAVLIVVLILLFGVFVTRTSFHSEFIQP